MMTATMPRLQHPPYVPGFSSSGPCLLPASTIIRMTPGARSYSGATAVHTQMSKESGFIRLGRKPCQLTPCHLAKRMHAVQRQPTYNPVPGRTHRPYKEDDVNWEVLWNSLQDDHAT